MQVKSNQPNLQDDDDKFELVSWDVSYATNIPLIDGQHKELIDLINALYAACLAGTESAGSVFKVAMKKMVDYVHFHFGVEQDMLARVNYPELHDHKHQHSVLIQEVLNAAKDFSEGNKYAPNRFVRTLRDWVLSHIAVYDRRYAYYIADQKKKGLITDAQING